MKERKHRYLCGYLGDKNCLYGNPLKDKVTMQNTVWVNPMTLYQATRYAEKINERLGNIKEKDKMQVFEIKLFN